MELTGFPRTFKEFKGTTFQCRPYYFGLGFIKVRLDGLRSMNFYSEEFDSTASREELHNHRNDFSSVVMGGTLINDLYAFHPTPNDDATHASWEAKCAPGEDESCVDYGVVEELCSTFMRAGTRYHIKRDAFHRVAPDGYAVTALTRSNALPNSETALVLRPIGAPSVCPYSKNFDDEKIDREIERIYGLMNGGKS